MARKPRAGKKPTPPTETPRPAEPKPDILAILRKNNTGWMPPERQRWSWVFSRGPGTPFHIASVFIAAYDGRSEAGDAWYEVDSVEKREKADIYLNNSLLAHQRGARRTVQTEPDQATKSTAAYYGHILGEVSGWDINAPAVSREEMFDATDRHPAVAALDVVRATYQEGRQREVIAHAGILLRSIAYVALYPEQPNS